MIFSTMLSASQITVSVSMLFKSDPTWCFTQLFRTLLNVADTGVDINLSTLRTSRVDRESAGSTVHLPWPFRRTLMAGGPPISHSWAEVDLSPVLPDETQQPGRVSWSWS